MNVSKIRKITDENAKEYSNAQQEEIENDMRFFADLIIDMYLEMTPEERKKWHEEHKTYK